MAYQPGAIAGLIPTPIETFVSYTEFTANVTVSGTNGAETTVVTAPFFVADGATVYEVTFSATEIATGASDLVVVILFEQASNLGQMAVCNTNTVGIPVYLRRRLTPASGNRQYIIKAYRTTNNGTIVAGAGGSNVALPGYIKITKAV